MNKRSKVGCAMLLVVLIIGFGMGVVIIRQSIATFYYQQTYRPWIPENIEVIHLNDDQFGPNISGAAKVTLSDIKEIALTGDIKIYVRDGGGISPASAFVRYVSKSLKVGATGVNVSIYADDVPKIDKFVFGSVKFNSDKKLFVFKANLWIPGILTLVLFCIWILVLCDFIREVKKAGSHP